jgi:gamma-glutamyl-gamma-aminobutyrate hydrolase PuuD
MTAKVKVKRARVLVMGHVDAQIVRAGGTPVKVSTSDDSAHKAIAAGKVDALLLTGGSDISPNLYGAKPHAATGDAWVERDLAELLALQAAVKAGIPILGICRGAQMLNAGCGGTLHQHVPALKGSGPHSNHTRGVRPAKGSRLAKAFGGRERETLHLHHQAVNKVAPGFVATGWASDGVVECIESVEGWMMGVQFHPEMHRGPGSQEIFDLFVAAAAKSAGLPAPARPAAKPAQAKAIRQPSPKPKAKPKVRRDRLQTWSSPVLSSWKCFRCGILFDEREDHVDHMWILHGVDVESHTEHGRALLWDGDEDMMWEGVDA